MSILNRGHARHGIVVPKLTSPISGRYYGYMSAFQGSGSTVPLAADLLYALPFHLLGPLPSGTVDRIALNFTVAAAAGKLIRLGIYSALANGLPDALLVDSGALAADTAAPFIASATISQALVPGVRYWLSLVTNGTPTVTCITVTEGAFGNATADATVRSQGIYRAFTYAALPATWGTHTSYTSSNVPNIVVRAT